MTIGKLIGLLLLLMSTRDSFSLAEIDASSVPQKNVEIFSGFAVALYDHELRIKLDLEKMLLENAVQSGRHNHDGAEKKPNGMMSGFGSMLVMIPLIMQIISLPGAIASVKMSLLKSLLVAKLALLVMLFNMLRNQQPTEVVVVHQGSAQHHDHFYPHYHREDYEDDDKGWFG